MFMSSYKIYVNKKLRVIQQKQKEKQRYVQLENI